MLCLSLNGFAQQEKVWVFGPGNAGLDFKTDPPTPFRSALTGYGEASASVSDNSGDLLFYTEGSRVWNKNGQLMPNGDDLTGLPLINNTYPPTSSTAQGALIVPKPGDKNMYYIFSLSSNEVMPGRLYYSVVDMRLNNGLGDVIAAQKGILLDTGLSEQLAAVTGDHCNIWIVSCTRLSNQFKAFEINEAGVSHQPVISNNGWWKQSPDEVNTGKIAFAHNRKKMVATNFLMGTAIFDFNPSTGLVTNPVSIDETGAYGICFSPDDDNLYLSSLPEHPTRLPPMEILQFDLSSGNQATIAASRLRLGTLAIPLSDLKEGPDGKIYFIYGEYTLGTIEKPDLKGTVCAYAPIKISLLTGTRAYGGLPAPIPVFHQETITNSTTINCFSDSIITALDTTGRDYVWQDNAVSGSHAVTGPATYWVKYTKAPCYTFIDTFHIKSIFRPLFTVETMPSCAHTANGQAKVTLSSANTRTYTYQWKKEGNDSVIGTADQLNYIAPGWYTLTISNSDGCDTTVNLHVPALPFDTFHQTIIPSCNGLPTGSTRIHIVQDSTHLYRFEWRSVKDTVILSRNDSVYGLLPGDYSVLITKEGTCDTQFTFTVPDISYEASFVTDSLACVHQAISFRNTSDPYFEEYLWLFGDGHHASGMHPDHTYIQSGIYKVSLIAKKEQCSDTGTQIITVKPTIDSFYFTTDRKSICIGEEITLNVYGLPGNTKTQRKFADHISYTTTGHIVQHAYSEPGQYIIVSTVYPEACPPLTFSDTIYVSPFPALDLGPDSVICLKDSVVMLHNRLEQHNSDVYLWNNKDTASILYAKHPGTYSLTIINKAGCATTGTINVKKGCYLNIPNAFTPNGDGINDHFFPRQLLSSDVAYFELHVFNRWGQLVFSTSGKNGRGWDGRFNGKIQPPGTYIYKISVHFTSGAEELYNGNITLIR